MATLTRRKLLRKLKKTKSTTKCGTRSSYSTGYSTRKRIKSRMYATSAAPGGRHVAQTKRYCLIGMREAGIQ